MTFDQIFNSIKDKFIGTDVSDINENVAIQVNLTGESGGTFYIEVKDKKLAIEPFSYNDRSVELTASVDNFRKMAEGKLDPVAAFTFGKLKVNGDIGKALMLKKFIK